VFSRDIAIMKAASPIQHVSKDLPSTLLIVGEKDFPMLEGDVKTFAEKAKAAGVVVRTLVAKDRDHMGTVRSLLEDKSAVVEHVLAFLKEPLIESR
jgi:acetyl esterase/lipase